MWPVVALLLFRFQPAFNLASGEVVTQWTSSRGRPRTCGYGEVSDFSSAGNDLCSLEMALGEVRIMFYILVVHCDCSVSVPTAVNPWQDLPF
ncbi:hypothetical protein CEXT_781611 [Caerostris extrusa]|uniref:Secreted protein n=1 Tax=Caerostris extrusa TaxID=172846 RepID=A0AAV4UKB6_CAEEX|nr:hypothetical protein CEXT_781611 [Caerostris extrusa]